VAPKDMQGSDRSIWQNVCLFQPQLTNTSHTLTERGRYEKEGEILREGEETFEREGEREEREWE